VMNVAFSEARNTIASAISPGLAPRLSGTDERKAIRKAAWRPAERFAGQDPA
jgi:hypothetical protein